MKANPAPLPRSTADYFTKAAHFWKGRVALYAILKVLGIGPGDRVVVPGYSCVVVPTAVKFTGAEPVFADVDPATYNMLLSDVEAAAGESPVKAVIVQHTYGMPADTGPIARWARRRGAWVIEDCCHALGGRYRDIELGDDAEWQALGTLGDAAFYSSQWSKPFTTGLGGWARAPDESLQSRLCRFAADECVEPTWRESTRLAVQMALYRSLFRPSLYWLAQDTLRGLSRWGLFVGSSDSAELDIRMPADYAKRMWRRGARIAARQAKRVQPLIEHRRWLKDRYDRALRAAGLPTFDPPDYADPVLLRYPLRVADKPGLLAEARRRRIELGDWFDHPLHPAGANVAALGWNDALCPAAQQAAASVVNLPMHSRIEERNIRRIVDFLASAQAAR